MVIGRVASEGEDDNVTKASAADRSSAGPYQEEESPPQGLRAAKHITGVWRCLLPRGIARWDFPSTCQPSCPNFITCTCELEVTRLYCQHWKSVTQREQSCFHSAFARLGNDAPRKNIQILLGITHRTAGECAARCLDSSLGLCEFLKICEGPEAHSPHCAPPRLLSLS